MKPTEKLILIFLLFVPVVTSAQEATRSGVGNTGLRDYILEVTKGNLGYLAEQFNPGIADASLRAARAFRDPELAAGYGDNQDHSLGLGREWNAGISYSLNLGNPRLARIGVATVQKDLSSLVLEDYLRNLRAEAAITYYQTVRSKFLANVQLDTYLRMKELAQADSLRLMSGMIMEVDARQSAMEARLQKNESIRAEAEWRSALVRYRMLKGPLLSDTTDLPLQSLEYPLREFTLAGLIDTALVVRTDLRQALLNHRLTEKMLRLIKANRGPEIGLESGMAYNTIAINEIAPSPSHYSYTVGLAFPLKFSSLNKGEIEAANLSVRQKEVVVKNVENQIVSEVQQAYLAYLSGQRQLEEFHRGLLTESETILDKKIYSYKRGETSLLDVLLAQRTYNEIRRSFYETHYIYLEALIALERATGIWDME